MNLQKYNISCCPKWIYFSFSQKNKGSIYLNINKKYLKELTFFQYFNNNTQAKLMSDITIADYPSFSKRFLNVYNVLSILDCKRFFNYFWTNELDQIDSLISIHPSSNWYEREAYDMYGIHYVGNDDLRRILTDYGFVGSPLRKDFPLVGYFEISYNSKMETLLWNETSLVQEFRNYNLNLPWAM